MADDPAPVGDSPFPVIPGAGRFIPPDLLPAPGDGAGVPPPPGPRFELSPDVAAMMVDRPPAEEGGGFMSRGWRSVRSAATGEGRMDNPEIPNLIGSDFRMPEGGSAIPATAALYLGASPEQLESILRRDVPGATFRSDSQGNRIMRSDGQEYYVAKPGFGLDDAMALAGTAAGGAGMARLATRFGPRAAGLIGTAGRIGLQAAGQGAATYGEGQAVDALGGGAGAATDQILLATAFGGLGQGVAEAGRALVRMWGGRGRILARGTEAADDAPGTPAMLTTTGRQVLQSAGREPADFTVGQLREMERRANGYADMVAAQRRPADQPSAARMLTAGVRQDVPLTAGQMSQESAPLFGESVLRKGPGSDVMAAFDEMQRARLLGAARAATGTAADEEQLGQRIGGAIDTRGQQLAGEEREAWAPFNRLSEAGEATNPGRVLFSRDVSDGLRDRMADMATETGADLINPRFMPLAAEARRLMAGMTMMRDAAGSIASRPFNLGAMNSTRQALGTLARTAEEGSPERRFIVRMTAALDDSVNDAMARGALSGDPARIEALRDAYGSTTREANFWGQNSPVAQKFMGDLREGRLQGQQVYDAIWGLGELNQGGAARQILDHVEQQFGRNSDIWRDLQASAMKNILLGRTAKGYDMGPQKFLNRVTEATEGRGRALYERLDLPLDDLADLRDLQRGLQRAQSPNPSGTMTTGLAHKFNQWATRLPFGTWLMGKMINPPQRSIAMAERAVGDPRGAAVLRRSAFPIERRTWDSRFLAPGLAAGGGLLGQYEGR